MFYMREEKNWRKIIASLGLVLCVLVSVFALASCSDEAEAESIAILYETDVHCAVDGYPKLAAMRNELADSFDHVGVVSSGDFIQGGTLGAVSKGEYIVDLMNMVGYDAIALGNHEFDYLLSRLDELNDRSNSKFLSCNFSKIAEDELYFEPYSIVSYGDVKVAYIGITTPETVKISNPSQFKNENGELIYTFSEENLYETVQKNIDAAEREGADYIIALSHIGYDASGNYEDIQDLVENTYGLDVVLDGHAHVVIEEMTLLDKSGKEVIVSSTGTGFEYIGKLTITKDEIKTSLVKTETYNKTDADVNAYLDEIKESYAELGNRIIGQSLVTLKTHDGDTRLVRNSETALGNLCSDALRVMTGADISYVNGGGLRAPIDTGDVTFNELYSVFPYNNQVVKLVVSGRTILDMLEMGVMNYPAESGSFPSMSGLTFSINTAIPTAVKVDSKGFFVGVDGDYRVYDVAVLDKDSGTYKPLDLDAKYVIAGNKYHFVDFGDGLAMFKDAKLVESEGTLDIEILEEYIVDCLEGVIGEEYAEPQGRITVTDGYQNDLLYSNSVLDAENASALEIKELVTLTKDNDIVTWNEDGTKVLLLSWHKYPSSYPDGSTFTCSYGEVWVFTDGEILAWYDENNADVTDWELRLEQLIGLPTWKEYTHVTAFWVDLDEVVRPAFNPDVTEQITADQLDGSVLGDLQDWFDGNADWSYSDNGYYPWTRLGYTYDWANNGTDYGLTEFIILKNSVVEVEWTKSNAEFIAWMQAN